MRRFRELFGGYGMKAFEFLFIDDTAVDDTQVGGGLVNSQDFSGPLWVS